MHPTQLAPTIVRILAIKGIAAVFVLATAFPSPGTPAMILKNDSLEFRLDPATGHMSLRHASDGKPLLDAVATALLADSPLTLTRYSSSAEADDAVPHLPGKSFNVRSSVPARGVDLTLTATLLSTSPGLVLELAVTNIGTTPVQILSLQPVRGLLNEQAGASFPCTTLLTNGRIYYDPGRLLPFDSTSTETIDSFWNAAFHHQPTGNSLVAGFLDNIEGEGHILTRRDAGDQFDFIAESRRHSRVFLQPGQSTTSGRLLLLLSDDGFSGLENYAGLMAKLHNAKLNPIINGWCSWFPYYGNVSEENVLQNAAVQARELLPYGMEWVQIDDGFQRTSGDWRGQPAKFPQGMKGTAQRIRELGLKPGLWLAPFAVSANSPLAIEHPEWLAHRPNGELQLIVPAHQPQAQYILDTTHPGAYGWLRDLLRTITADWGYDFIKTDFSEWTLLSVEQFTDPSASSAKAYRLGVEAIREGMGPHRHMLDCGTGPTVVGLIDSMRIELDRPVPENPLWDQYAGYYNSTGPAVAKRYFFHNRTWINDADHIRLVGLTLPQGRAAATITALSGGNMISGDRLSDLDPERMDILKRVLPAWGQAARPLDLFTTDSAELFSLPIKSDAGKWQVLGVFNWSGQPRTRRLDLKALGIASGKPVLVHDFWSQKLLGETTAVLDLVQEPTSVHLLSLREKTGVPQVLGTDRHFTQGALELRDVRWNETERTLSGTAKGAPAMTWNLSIYVPEGYEPESGKAGEAQADVGEDRVLRAPVKFAETDEVAWGFRFK